MTSTSLRYAGAAVSLVRWTGENIFWFWIFLVLGSGKIKSISLNESRSLFVASWCHLSATAQRVYKLSFAPSLVDRSAPISWLIVAFVPPSMKTGSLRPFASATRLGSARRESGRERRSRSSIFARDFLVLKKWHYCSGKLHAVVFEQVFLKVYRSGKMVDFPRTQNQKNPEPKKRLSN